MEDFLNFTPPGRWLKGQARQRGQTQLSQASCCVFMVWEQSGIQVAALQDGGVLMFVWIDECSLILALQNS